MNLTLFTITLICPFPKPGITHTNPNGLNRVKDLSNLLSQLIPRKLCNKRENPSNLTIAPQKLLLNGMVTKSKSPEISVLFHSMMKLVKPLTRPIKWSSNSMLNILSITYKKTVKCKFIIEQLMVDLLSPLSS